MLILITILHSLCCVVLGSFYINEFVAKLEGGQRAAEDIAHQLGLQYLGLVEPFEDVYVFSHAAVPSRHRRAATEHSGRLSRHPSVQWVEQQIDKVRVKRHLAGELSVDEQRIEREAYSKLADSYNDPFWPRQAWYLRDEFQTPGNITFSTKTDLRVLPVWQKGFTGKNVVISILDDGLEWNNTDLVSNYAPHASYDLNDDDYDPFPRYDPTDENKHGTRCAGIIAMASMNKFCGVGIAPDAKVGAVRMLDGKVTDKVEGQSLAFNVKNIDIMSASWGPSDNGKIVDGPGTLGSLAFHKGITEGRRGLGVIYVWASGNGGSRGDNCECDGYASSPYTVSISSASMKMKSPYYVEHCPSTMASTFSSGEYGDRKIVSADLHNGCTDDFTGTSAAAPQAAGLIALTLEANPKLGWRDVQHVIAWSSSPYPLYDNPGWLTNAAGFKVNGRFGFGLMNAIEMVEVAQGWENVGAWKQCSIPVGQTLPRELKSGLQAEVSFLASQCIGTDDEINYLEHVEVIVGASYSKRGALSLDLVSAQGTRVSLMRPRDGDFNSEGYDNWPFMSVQTWGENPNGVWTLYLFDDTKSESNKGQLINATLKIYGTKEMPTYMRKASGHRRTYNFQLEEVVKKRQAVQAATDDSEKESSESAKDSLTNIISKFTDLISG